MDEKALLEAKDQIEACDRAMDFISRGLDCIRGIKLPYGPEYFGVIASMYTVMEKIGMYETMASAIHDTVAKEG